MSAQDSTKRVLLSMRHPTTGTSPLLGVREPRGAWNGTGAGYQVSEPSIRTLACFPVQGSSADVALISPMPTNGWLGFGLGLWGRVRVRGGGGVSLGLGVRLDGVSLGVRLHALG